MEYIQKNHKSDEFKYLYEVFINSKYRSNEEEFNDYFSMETAVNAFLKGGEIN